MRSVCALFLTLATLHAQQPAQQPLDPTSKQLADLIARARASAMRFDGHLPDFSCTRITVRWEDPSGSGKKWKTRDSFEESLSFANDGQTVINLLKVNGAPTKFSQSKQLGGISTTKTLLEALVPHQLFDPEAEPQMEWGRWENHGGHQIAVLSLRGKGENVLDGKTRYDLKLIGLIFFDTSSGNVTRLQVAEQGPPGYPLKQGSWEMDYAPVMLAGRELILPVSGGVQGEINKTLFRNEMKFTAYHTEK